MTVAGWVQGVLVPPRVCLFLENNVDLIGLRGRTRGDDPEIDRVLLDLRRAAMASRADATSNATSRTDPTPSLPMTTQEAAARVGIAEGSIRAAIRRHRLPATKTGRRWLINPVDLDTYLGRSA